MDFSLSFSNSDIALHMQNTPTSVSLDRINIAMLSLAAPHLQLGFIAGSSNLSISNDPVTAGISLNGYHAGLALRSLYGHNPQIGFHANYLYQETKNETASQRVNLNWYEWSAGVTGEIRLGQSLGVIAGLTYSDIKARRSATGAVNATQNLDLDAGLQGQLGLKWHVAAGGLAGFSLQRGDYQRVEFTFSRSFR